MLQRTASLGDNRHQGRVLLRTTSDNDSTEQHVTGRPQLNERGVGEDALERNSPPDIMTKIHWRSRKNTITIQQSKMEIISTNAPHAAVVQGQDPLVG